MPAGSLVRDLGTSDVHAAARLHGQMADIQFIARGGPLLLRPYYRSWMSTDSALALGAFTPDGELVGVLLGCTDPSVHYGQMLRRGGVRSAAGMSMAALTRPAFARELLATRASRYSRALLERLVAPARRPGGPGAAGQGGAQSAPPEPARLGGEITHLVVDGARRGTGAGRLLVEEAARRCRQAGRHELELVAIPGSAAAAFYEHLGFLADKAVTSASGEEFVRYTFGL